MEKLLLIGVIGTGLCVLLRAMRPEYALPVGIVTGVLMLWLLMEELTGFLSMLREIGDRYGVSAGYFGALLKMVGIAYLAQFGANFCRDHGQSAIAEKLELGGRICVLTCAMPAVVTLLESGTAILRGGMP